MGSLKDDGCEDGKCMIEKDGIRLRPAEHNTAEKPELKQVRTNRAHHPKVFRFTQIYPSALLLPRTLLLPT